MAEHTPGPWSIHEQLPAGASVRGLRGRLSVAWCSIATSAGASIVSIQMPEALANANLIAAAPDLLAALELIAEDIDYDTPDKYTLTELRDLAEAAIKRAKGEDR